MANSPDSQLVAGLKTGRQRSTLIFLIFCLDNGVHLNLLASTKFSKPIYENAAKAFVARYQASANNPRASLGHWVGMATHDVGPYEGVLRAGMVFTIEPALTVPEEKIYIRLEDLIVITQTGKEIVSDFIPMDMDQIEKLMKETGMLQRYPRDGETKP